MKRLKRVFLAVILIAVILIGAFAYLISPVKSFQAENIQVESGKELLASKLIDAVKSKISNKNLTIDTDISEQELNGLLASEAKGKDIHAVIDKDQIIIYINDKILQLPTQYIIYCSLLQSDGDIYLKINKFYMGRLQIPEKMIVNKMKSKFPELNFTNDNSIKISSGIPKALSMSDIQVDNNIKFKIQISVNSKLELLELLIYLYPKNYNNFIK